MRSVREVMGMPVTVDVRDGGAERQALDEVFADFEFVDQVFSPFISDSEVSRIDRGELRPEDSSPLVQQVLNLCRLYEIATDGYFSAWIAGRLDPSGLVKGWAIDRACGILDGYGYTNYYVEAAGDVRTRRPSGTGEPWRIGIRHPVERDKVTRVIEGGDLAVATSGTYEKGAHIRDPHTGGRPRDGSASPSSGPTSCRRTSTGPQPLRWRTAASTSSKRCPAGRPTPSTSIYERHGPSVSQRCAT